MTGGQSTYLRQCDLPQLSGLQFLILRVLGNEVVRGKDLRNRLAEKDYDVSLPAFYQMMARLEDKGFVHPQKIGALDNPSIREVTYYTTIRGIEEIQHTINFYSK